MSDYFGALMRSSAMTVGGVAPARAVPRPVTSLEVVGERLVPATAAHAANAPIVATPVAPATVAAATAQNNEGNEHAGDPPARDATNSASVNDGVAQTPPEAAHPGIVARESKVAPAHEVVRAAMRWVAADPQQAAPTPAASEHAWHEEAAAAPQAHTTVVAVLTPPPARSEPAESVAPRAMVVQADARLTPTPPAAAETFAAPAHDERFEISIGAIHLRVDAPAPQTVARTAPAPSPAARSAHVAPTPPRSALARRALRRI
ncbi:MAG: hypothetical protein ABIO45_05565 [Burkholderiaceae bacterium]